MSKVSKPHSERTVQHAVDALRSDLANLDPAVHREDLAAATEMALDDLRYLEEQLEAKERERIDWESTARVESDHAEELREQFETLQRRHDRMQKAIEDFVRPWEREHYPQLRSVLPDGVGPTKSNPAKSPLS